MDFTPTTFVLSIGKNFMKSTIPLFSFLALLCIEVLGSFASPVDQQVIAQEKQSDKHAQKESLSPWQKLILEDEPIGYWSFDQPPNQTQNLVSDHVSVTKLHGTMNHVTGPDDSIISWFDATNKAIEIGTSPASIRIKDLPKNNRFAFGNGETITMEAWVAPDRVSEGQQVYIIGKGRTQNKGYPADNQNYSLRLRGVEGQAHVSFLFKGKGKSDRDASSWFRWNSDQGFPVKSGWHHVILTYTFGEKNDPVCWIDGMLTKGSWDMGSANTTVPVTDDDELWIGSSMNQNPNSTFIGKLDEIAIYRHALSPARIQLRTLFQKIPPAPPLPEIASPKDRVLVEIFENVPDTKSWNFSLSEPTETEAVPVFAFVESPRKYNRNGVQIDRSPHFVIRARSLIQTPQNDYRILLRARNGARLFIDGKEVLAAPFHNISGTAHGKIRHVTKIKDEPIRQLQTGDNEVVKEVKLSDGFHEFQLDIYVGGGKKRPELGETSVSLATSTKVFHLLSPQREWSMPITEEGWYQFLERSRHFYLKLNAERRRVAARSEKVYWKRRHDYARKVMSKREPISIPVVSLEYIDPDQTSPQPSSLAVSPIDAFIGSELQHRKLKPAKMCDDWAFLRRVTLDVIGILPTPELIETFQKNRSPQRRAEYIDELLNQPDWADHWVSYWQDVLAENPNIVNPTLNNTGPFRWWIHESFIDNKPFDEFVTELIMMEGSTYYGGPAGFGMATQNDAPMAAKSHIIGQAFLGVEMKCARCHDAPFHDSTQVDLFQLGAMLQRASLKVPATSSLPQNNTNRIEDSLVKVSLKPGASVKPAWPFQKFSHLKTNELPNELFQNAQKKTDTREQLAALLTSPHNERFAKVIVNRMWKRYLGRGLMEPADDWESGTPTHPELLDYLARELVTHDYDLKHVARLILNSRTYQRVTSGEHPDRLKFVSFRAPYRRRMTAEQIVDSLFTTTGKRFYAGEVNIDADGSRNFNQSLNLGRPVRAWQFTSLSNERDRPSLSLPLAQPFVITLETFGWRSSRQSPQTEREEEVTVLQPAILSNGVLGQRFSCLSDESRFTELALKKQSISELVDAVFLTILTRPPSAEERAMFIDLLEPGYDQRLTPEANAIPKSYFHPKSTGVSWSNHLSPDASLAQIELARIVKAGEKPTSRLNAEWRDRMEDMLWTLLNTPEFLFVP